MTIKEARTAKNMTQKALAEAVGVSPEAVCQYENYKIKPSIEVLYRIHKVLEVTLDDLFEGYMNERKDE